MTSSHPNRDNPRGAVAASADKAATQPNKGAPGKREHRSSSPLEDATDDTQRRQAEERIRFQARLLDAVGQAIIATDPQGKIIYWNRAAEELYGWSKEEVIGRSILEVTPSEEMLERGEEIMSALMAGRSWSGEFMVRRKEGTTFPAHVTDTPVYDEEGTLAAIIGVSADITELKETEELLRSEERFRLLVEGVKDYAIFMLDTEGHVTSWNSGAERINGYRAEEIVGRHIACFFTEEDVVRGHPEEELRLAEEQGRYEEEGWRVRKDGTRFWANVLITALRDGEGNLRGFSKVVRDVTERKRAEEALRESEERFRTAFEDAPIGVALVDLDGRRFRANRALCEMLGCSEQDLLGKDYLEHVHPDDRKISTDHFRRTLEEGAGSYELERRYLRADGHVVWNLSSVSLIRDSKGNPSYFVCLHQDITERKRIEQEITELSQRNELILNSAGEGILGVDSEGRITFVNPAAATILGWEVEELIGRHGHPTMHHTKPDGTPYPREECPVHISIKDGIRRGVTDEVFWRKDGTSFLTEYTSTPIESDEEIVGSVITFSDVTERKQAQEALRESEQFFRALYEEVHHPIFLVDKELNFVDVNSYACEFYGYSREEFKQMKVSDITIPEELATQQEDAERLREQGEILIQERRHRKKSGEIVTVTADATTVTRAGQELYVSRITDITQRKQVEEQLKYQAFHDLLTDLPNRQLFVDRLEQALRRTRRRRKRKVAVLFMDLDNFKVINDSLGHECGDKLLVAVAERLRGCLRPEDTLTRFGGDEFTVLIDDVEDPEDAVRVAERLVECLRKPFALDGREFFVTVSIGIALGTARTKNPEELLREADAAMYQAKENGTRKYEVFKLSIHEQVLGRMEMENDLRRALQNEEFRVHYQPIVNLQSGEAWGVEALLRWEHPKWGLLDPEQFVPLAEESGLIVPIDRRVLEEACELAKEWREQKHPCIRPLVVCVNFSARQLEHPDCIQTVEEALQRSELEAASLTLDITESVYIRATAVQSSNLARLKELGVRISIDDFGTGYSSLSYLKRLPADELKLDRSFVGGIEENAKDTAIVRTVIELAHTLGMEVIAEGIETEAQVKQLKEMGCDRGQGFYFTQPLPPQAASEFFRVAPLVCSAGCSSC